MSRFALALAAMVALAVPAAAADTLSLFGFIVESDNDTKVALVTEDLKSIASGTDVFVLTEVNSPEVAEQYRAAAQAGIGAPFDKQVSKSGGSDRVVVLVEQAEPREAARVGIEGHLQSSVPDDRRSCSPLSGNGRRPVQASFDRARSLGIGKPLSARCGARAGAAATGPTVQFCFFLIYCQTRPSS